MPGRCQYAHERWQHQLLEYCILDSKVVYMREMLTDKSGSFGILQGKKEVVAV